VIGLSRYFKLPEEWQRQRRATTLTNVALTACFVMVIVALATGGLILFVKQVRQGTIRWGTSAKVAGIILAALVAAELNRISAVFQTYNTSIPLSMFWISSAAGLVIVPLAGALAAWLVIALATSLHPDAWRIFHPSARCVWRRDATVAIALALAAAFGLARLGALLYGHFHAVAPVRFDLGETLLDSTLPGAGFALRAVMYSVFAPAIVAVVLTLLRAAYTRRAWWMWVGGLLLLVSLGPSRAHSPAGFLVGWSFGLATLGATVLIMAVFLRNNVAAYVGTALALAVGEPLVSMASQPAGFFRWNAALLGLFAALVLGWLFSGSIAPSDSATAKESG
jgi:hypothetical protein